MLLADQRPSLRGFRPEVAVLRAAFEVRTGRTVGREFLQPPIRILRSRLVAAVRVHPVHAALVGDAAEFEMVALLNAVERRRHDALVEQVAAGEDVVDGNVIGL